ncbi:MAG: DUF4251 domain-containing protein [Rhizobacter sp.]|nr:DUF4251 domain-containing protein [Ferruginibacter sp.]
MKPVIRTNFFIAPLIIIGALLPGSCSTARQTTGTNERVSASIDSSRWTFTVETVMPQQGMTRQPNGTYSVIYKDGKLNVYLPYFGRAFSGADLLQGTNALDFISKDFAVDKEELGTDKWRISFKPNDQRQVQSMTFILFNNGSGSLDIILTNRSPIGYRGTVSKSK